MATLMRCGHCGEVKLCEGGYCDACRSYLGATGRLTRGTGRTCPDCNGTGKKVYIFGPDTKCPRCRGTGYI